MFYLFYLYLSSPRDKHICTTVPLQYLLNSITQLPLVVQPTTTSSCHFPASGGSEPLSHCPNPVSQLWRNLGQDSDTDSAETSTGLHPMCCVKCKIQHEIWMEVCGSETNAILSGSPCLWWGERLQRTESSERAMWHLWIDETSSCLCSHTIP